MKIFDILGAMNFETVFANFLTLCGVTNGQVIKKFAKKHILKRREVIIISIKLFHSISPSQGN